MPRPSEVIRHSIREIESVYPQVAEHLRAVWPTVRQLEDNNVTLALSVPVDLTPKPIK